MTGALVKQGFSLESSAHLHVGFQHFKHLYCLFPALSAFLNVISTAFIWRFTVLQ